MLLYSYPPCFCLGITSLIPGKPQATIVQNISNSNVLTVPADPRHQVTAELMMKVAMGEFKDDEQKQLMMEVVNSGAKIPSLTNGE